MYSPGIRTSSKKISPWSSARCPSLSRGLPRDTPGRSSGTTATPPPFDPVEAGRLLDTSYQWLVFLEEDDKKLKQIYNDYKSGKLLSGELKAILIEKLNSFLKEHQKKREQAKKTIDKYIYKE